MRGNHCIAEHVFCTGGGKECGMQKTNLKMDVYRQALSVREEQLLPST